jgi:hypothetical protein
VKITSKYLKQEFDSEELAKKFGTVKFEENTLYLTQKAYTQGGASYKALAIDDQGNDYTVTWITTEEWNSRKDYQRKDASKACDWQKYTVIKK